MEEDNRKRELRQFDGDNPPEGSVLQHLWTNNYPFTYWGNRLNKINQLNPHDQMEAVFVLLQLADTYVTILAAMVRNPHQPWFMVRDKTYRHHIDSTLEEFEVMTSDGDRFVDLGTFEETSDEIIGLDIGGEWADSIEALDYFAGSLLGCPADINFDNQQVTFHEDRDVYISLCNGVIQLWQEHVDLLNDLKHGFRLLTFDWDSMEEMLELGFVQYSDEDLDGIRSDYEQTKDDYVYFWRLEGGPIEDEEWELGSGEEIDSGFRLVVYRIEMERSVRMAHMILSLLFNLINPGEGNHRVVNQVEPLIDDDGVLKMFETFLKGDLKYGEP